MLNSQELDRYFEIANEGQNLWRKINKRIELVVFRLYEALPHLFNTSFEINSAGLGSVDFENQTFVAVWGCFYHGTEDDSGNITLPLAILFSDEELESFTAFELEKRQQKLMAINCKKDNETAILRYNLFLSLKKEFEPEN